MGCAEREQWEGGNKRGDLVTPEWCPNVRQIRAMAQDAGKRGKLSQFRGHNDVPVASRQNHPIESRARRRGDKLCPKIMR